ncbi:hypothetical protein [Bacillus sp. FJAT-27225]|uniref:hypothetical protein n=1 Tax=Bacillus sp. FJAT-27225 TaxID=1743144 RepID=UPI0015868E9D|nr:hypothetical protein [Bacillus sp. FJAT-27225]
MKVLGAYLAWVLIMIIEIFWLLIDSESQGGNKETIYVIMVISLVVGNTGINLLKKVR